MLHLLTVNCMELKMSLCMTSQTNSCMKNHCMKTCMPEEKRLPTGPIGDAVIGPNPDRWLIMVQSWGRNHCYSLKSWTMHEMYRMMTVWLRKTCHRCKEKHCRRNLTVQPWRNTG